MTQVRTRRTKAEIAQLERQILDVLREDRPQSVRHIFYRLTNPRLPVPIDKSEAGYKQVQHRTVEMRKNDRLPYGWIADQSRRGYHTPQYSDSAEFIRANAALYRGLLWTNNLPVVEVWCESKSIAGVLQGLCADLSVSLYPTSGFSSLSYTYEAAKYINSLERPVSIYYIGDYDASGLDISRNLEVQLTKHLEVPLTFDRIAINEGQIAEYDLPAKPPKAGDRRQTDVKVSVETESLPAHILRALVKESVESHLPEGQLHAVKVAEEDERRYLEVFQWAP